MLGTQGELSSAPRWHRASDSQRVGSEEEGKAWVRRGGKSLKESQKGQAKAEVVTPGPTAGPSIRTLICVCL